MEDAASARAWRVTVRKRLLVMAAAFVLWALAIEARLVYLQVYQHDEQVARANAQRSRTMTVPGRRGAIVDRHGRTLAMSVSAESLYAVPSVISNPEAVVARVCAALDQCSPAERDALVQKIRQNKKRAFLYLRRLISPDETRRILREIDVSQKHPLKGVSLVTESRRVFPNRELAAHVLGYVGVDNSGLAGIEASYNSRIQGKDGTVLIEVDGSQGKYGRIERPPTAGATVVLTIDAQIQHIAERELRAAIDEHHAVAGTVVVMDPRSGEILALANEPTFNPNAYREAEASTRRNRGVQEIYEPGSTFKIVTASAAIQERVFSPDELIDVSAGQIKVGASRTVRDVHAYGPLSFTDVIVKSSNVGAIKVGNRLGPERLGRYVTRFGFGERMCPDMPGETPGMLSPASSWSAGALASISMGYEIGVTPIQMATAFSSVANGGALFQPRVVHAVQTGSRQTTVEPRELRRTIDAGTIAEVLTIMEQVVDRGTGKAARVPGFTVAGKTGTAAKIVNGRYSKSDYFASFAGFVPSRAPAITVLVVIDTPRGRGYPTSHHYYGGDVAAPVFKRVAEQTLRYLGVAPTVDPAPPVLVAAALADSASGLVSPTAAHGGSPALDVLSGAPVIPELRGLGAREAVRRLTHLGLVAQLSGDGVVQDQQPPPGTPIEGRTTCALRLRRTYVPPPPSGAPQ